MDARSIIAQVRQGETPPEAEITWFAQGLANGDVTDAQAGAFAMAVWQRGLSVDARWALTAAMRDSGEVLTWNLPGPVVDKHSTGGVGDCVSLLLAPALAVCGAYVPMISGRGLGHTGGTLDKLEAIPGVNTQVSEDSLRRIVAEVGCAIVGATGAIAPADKRLYAVRDVTATVDSLDLITASILSKKLAASPEALILDIKIGSGAFMKTPGEARALASSLVDTANAAGCATVGMITDMNQPLVPSLGNALEVAEVMRALSGERRGRIFEITEALGGVLLAQAGLATDAEEGSAKIMAALRDGTAKSCFAKMIVALGGPLDFEGNWRAHLAVAPEILEVRAGADGFVTAMDGEARGHLVVRLGGGRLSESDKIDPAVGISDLLPLGAAVGAGDVIARIHGARADVVSAEAAHLRASVTISHEAPEVPALLVERLG